MILYTLWAFKYDEKTRMITSISSEALKILRKIFMKQKVEEESVKEKKNHETFQQLANFFTFTSFVALPTDLRIKYS